MIDDDADEKARIAALHRSAPDAIWLQVDPEAEQFDGWEAQTWCADKINDTDVMYVRADEIERLRTIERAAQNLVAVKGRHHSEQAYLKLVEALK